MGDSPVRSTRSPEEAFSLLGNDTRMRIIEALWRTGNEPISFSELRKHADVADSGQFNYHLGKLVGTFVRRNDDGYELTYAGRRVIGAILDGTYTKRAEVEPFEIGMTCFACGSSLEASYADERFVVRCPDCDVTSEFGFPPGALDGRTRAELVETSAHWVRAQFSLIVNGICPNCAGVMTHSVIEDQYPEDEVGLEYGCDRCLHRAVSPVGLRLFYHPTVISFYDDHGIDLTEGRWDVWMRTTHLSTTVRSDDPWRISVTIQLEDEELELVVDEEVTIIEQHRK